jgi:hypothetical protein
MRIAHDPASAELFWLDMNLGNVQGLKLEGAGHVTSINLERPVG